jgi:hypothetical protein
MIKALAIVLLAACSSEPYTWGTTSDQLAQIYCHGQDYCGGILTEDVDVCIEHVSFHLCAFDGTCDLELDQSTAEEALTACDEAMGRVDEFGCYLLTIWGIMPHECAPVFDLEPEVP